MTDLWTFLMQTLTVSGVAAFLLLVKALLRDKLSPRWQFSVWGLLLPSLLLPAGCFGRYILADWPLLVTRLKQALTGDYTAASVTAFLPLCPGWPHTLWDWLFFVYLGGVLVLAVRYLAAYFKLKGILHRSMPVSPVMAERIHRVEEAYHLKACRAVMVPGLQTAFVCGLIHPILALPAGRDTDEKVLLHELLHLRHRDVLWGVLLGFFRCIHWCNPFLWYCFDCIGNDMESLCDQRVLEHLEGEDRRDYGRILLSMASKTYARTPGTSSAANGGKNIRRRIEAIARFRRYPAGMELVSVCIAILLLGPLGWGSTVRALPGQDSREDVDKMLTLAAMTECSTPENAVECYARSILTQNGAWRVMAAPSGEREPLIQAFKAAGDLYLCNEAPKMVWQERGYSVYDWHPVSDGEYQGVLAMDAMKKPDRPANITILTQKISVRQEGRRWTVVPLGAIHAVDSEENGHQWGAWELPGTEYTAVSGDFRVTVQYQPICQPHDHGTSTEAPDTAFSAVRRCTRVNCTYIGPAERREDYHEVGVENVNGGLSMSQSVPEFWESGTPLGGSVTTIHYEDWDFAIPEQFTADLYLNGKKAAELTLKKEGAQ